MNEDYYIEYYDQNNRRHYTKYYPDRKEAEAKAEEIKSQGNKEVKIITFRY